MSDEQIIARATAGLPPRIGTRAFRGTATLRQRAPYRRRHVIVEVVCDCGERRWVPAGEWRKHRVGDRCKRCALTALWTSRRGVPRQQPTGKTGERADA